MNTQWAKKATTVAVLGCAGVLALGGVASAVEAPPIGHAVTQDDPNPNPAQGTSNGSDQSNCTNDGATTGDAGTDDPNATAPDGTGPSDNCAPGHDGNPPDNAGNAPADTPQDGAGEAGPGTGGPAQ
ncbi:MAG TPA: hypothetical protein VGL04_00165 [Sporichthyaceae bacterium]